MGRTRSESAEVVRETRADPITTEVIRHALRSAAGQMRAVLMHTAFSQLVYEVLDFACALYDMDSRLLAQAPSLGLFLGTLDSCLKEALRAVGGPESLENGDILVYNLPYGTGSHPQDAVLITPAFFGPELVGFAVVKAHWVDIGGKDVYSADTVELLQEGTMFPGVRLFKAGARNDDVWRIILANSRAPSALSGDLNSMIGAVRTGGKALTAIVEKHGRSVFNQCTERMLAHGEEAVRDFIRRLPDGRYTTAFHLDNNCASDEPIVFDIAVEVRDSELIVDLTGAPAQQAGPINSPLPGTVSAGRVALASLVGPKLSDNPNEGHFRPLSFRTKVGSLFHPVTPAPSFVFWVTQIQLIEGIINALAPALPERIPAESGADIVAICWWGNKRADFQARAASTAEPWIDGAPAPIGQGAHYSGDGSSSLMHMSESATRISAAEVWEAKNPWLIEKMELAPDSCGPGRHRGGLGVDIHIRTLEDLYITSMPERTKWPPQGLFGGKAARPNRLAIQWPDGRVTELRKKTKLRIPKGSLCQIETAGGGGYGPPDERDLLRVVEDVRDGYVSRDHAAQWYPRAAQLLASLDA